MKTLITPLLIGALLTTGIALTPNANAARSDHSIWVGSYGSISNWRAVARDQVILWNGPSRAYLVEVWRPTGGALRFSEAIGVTTTAGRVTKFDSILVRGQRLPIKQIQRIDPQLAKAMRYRS